MHTLSVIQKEFARLSSDFVQFRKLSRDCLNSQRAMWGRLYSLHGVEGGVELDDSPNEVIDILMTEPDADKHTEFHEIADGITYDPFIYNLCIGETNDVNEHIELTDMLDILTRPGAKKLITENLTQDEIVHMSRNFLTIQSAILWTINFNALRQAEQIEREETLPEDFGESADDRYTESASVAVFSANMDDPFDDELEAKLEEYKNALLAVHLCNQISTILMSFLDL